MSTPISSEEANLAILQKCDSRIASESQRLIAVVIGFFGILVLLEKWTPHLRLTVALGECITITLQHGCISFQFLAASLAYLASVTVACYELLRIQRWVAIEWFASGSVSVVTPGSQTTLRDYLSEMQSKAIKAARFMKYYVKDYTQQSRPSIPLYALSDLRFLLPVLIIFAVMLFLAVLLG